MTAKLSINGHDFNSEGELSLYMQLVDRGIDVVPQFRFSPSRKWAADFAIPHAKLLVEVEGGVFAKGRHTTGTGFTEDCRKYNAAIRQGYRVLRFTTEMVFSLEAINTIVEVLEREGKKA